MTGPEYAAAIERAWTENTDAPDGMPRCGECGRLLHSDIHTPGCHVPTAKAALDALVALARKGDVPDGWALVPPSRWSELMTAEERANTAREELEVMERSYATLLAKAEERASQLERELEAAWAPDRHGHQISEPRWSLRDIDRWMKALLADEGQREAVLALARVSQLERDLEVAQSMDMTATAEQWEAACKQARREADQLRAALEQIAALEDKTYYDDPSAGFAAVARAALAGVQAKEGT